MTRRIYLSWASAFTLLASSTAMAEPPAFVSAKHGGEVLLFDAGSHDLNGVRNYTARWKKGSDLLPTATPVSKDDSNWIEFTFRGRHGMACSTLYFEKLPEPDAGMQYQGIQFILDCDRDDYPHIGVTVAFSDQSTLSHDVTLEQGRHEYLVNSGFRREKYPPHWDLLRYVMLTLDAGRHTTDVTYRLQRMKMRQVPLDASDPATDGRVPDLFAEPVISPRPKQLDWKQGVFLARKVETLLLDKTASERTRRTAEIFAERFWGFTGQRLAVATRESDVPAAGIVLRVAGASQTEAEDAVLPPQGYTLTADAERVVITGADEPGLYYGTVTFFQVLRHALKKATAEIPVPCVQIRDWPDTLNRMVRLEHPHTFRNYAVRENRGIDYLIDWTDRFVAGNKYNTLYIDLSANVRYERRPEFNGSEKIYSLDDLRRFGQFCRDHFVDLCPAWQIGGHANWWLTIGYHPELREKGWPSQGDVTHPDHDPIVYDCMLDVIEALQPKYLSPKSDEWWHERRADETPDELLHGKTRAQAFLDFHTKLNAWLHERGITMMIYEDMLSPYHNGKRFDTYRMIDAFPKDVILTLWSGGNTDKEICHFTDRGFRVWPNATGMFTLSDDSKSRVMGFGKGIYSFGNDKARLLDEYSPLWSLSNILRTADYAWNLAQEENADPARLVAIEQLLAIRPNPRASEHVEPIELDAALTDSWGAFLKAAKPDSFAGHKQAVDLPRGPQEIGFLPMRLGGSEHDCVVLRKNSTPVTLPVRGRFASLIFLHTGFVHDSNDKTVAGVRIREWIYGWPCGNYVVHYADGSQAVLPVRLTNNIKRFDTANATRATLDNRYTWTVDDANGEPVHLFQWEWVNPRPDEEIVRVVAEHDGILDVSLSVFAISGRWLRFMTSSQKTATP
ncbi:MAG TPA: glycoside hydrolase family 20 zincin-like fold domain-containing protein [Thermoguttaceae bacterium]|nr:glycoside hydrolase family 20 zincin-like fold domain-containing protein [Thermoguttaceae bacterium]